MLEQGFKVNSEAEELVLESRHSKKQDEERASNQAADRSDKKLPLSAKSKGKLKYVSYKSPPDLALAEIHLVTKINQESHFSGKARTIRGYGHGESRKKVQEVMPLLWS